MENVPHKTLISAKCKCIQQRVCAKMFEMAMETQRDKSKNVQRSNECKKKRPDQNIARHEYNRNRLPIEFREKWLEIAR